MLLAIRNGERNDILRSEKFHGFCEQGCRINATRAQDERSCGLGVICTVHYLYSFVHIGPDDLVHLELKAGAIHVMCHHEIDDLRRLYVFPNGAK